MNKEVIIDIENPKDNDLISKQAVIERLKKEDKILYTTMGLNYLIRAIKDLPSVNPQEPCDDAVSRQELLKQMGEEPFNWTDTDKELQAIEDYRYFKNLVEQLPSVKPQPTGHCEDCKQFRKLPYHADTLGKCIHHTGFCPKGDWYCADFEPQEAR